MIRNLALVATVACLGILAAPMASAADITFQLTVDNCTGGCNPGPPGTSMGTVELTNLGGGAVQVTVTLFSPLKFVNTGLVNTIDFNLTGGPTVAFSGSTNSLFSLPGLTAGTNHFDGFGDFQYAVELCPPKQGGGCQQGAGSAQDSPETFIITCTGCTASTFTTNSTGAYFGVDVYNTVNGNTGPISTSGSTPVPEPTSVLLLGTGLAFAGKFLKKYVAS